ncbi:alpha/beta hydrolase [Sphingomonas psychrotolerans]|uniref:Alpha/beta hydrolase n=1 Tax=Sphingomonas psychrotolerans TaxID=1327635 RepID=A0ABU3N2C8_9SPHN|nr:alpha/beta hydrolase [Sphingomonas psychrotolerans]MDT8758632.1 alpha/beta hydrolase [Sphingomonas psychrotolerans]
MTTALTLPANLSLVEISAAASASLRELFGVPAQAHVPYRANTPSERNLLGARLDSAVTRAEGAVLLVAEGAGCFATAWWARLSPASYVSRVAGAVFLDPIDEGENVEALLDTFASPRTHLPFPSIVLGRDDRQALPTSQVRTLAEGWGSGVVAGSRSDPTGPLRRTRGIIARFTAGVVAREVRTHRALVGRVRAVS